MNILQDILTHFSSDKREYCINTHNVTIGYCGYGSVDHYYIHLFYLKKIDGAKNYLVDFKVAGPTDDIKDIHLGDFSREFTNALTILLDDIKYDILSYVERSEF